MLSEVTIAAVSSTALMASKIRRRSITGLILDSFFSGRISSVHRLVKRSLSTVPVVVWAMRWLKIYVLVVPTKLITNDGTVFDSSFHFPEGPDYVAHFPATNRIQQQRKVFVCCKVESSICLSHFKYGEKNHIYSHLKKTLIKNNKFNTHKENSIGWFKYISHTVSLQKTTRHLLEEVLMSTYMTEDETKLVTKVNNTCYNYSCL